MQIALFFSLNKKIKYRLDDKYIMIVKQSIDNNLLSY